MKRKIRLTMDRHKEIGAELKRMRRTLDGLACEVCYAYSVNGNEQKELGRAAWAIIRACTALEIQMLKDDHDASLRVYAGPLEGEPDPLRVWPLCDVCGRPVTTKDGMLAVSQTEIRKAEMRWDEWEKKHAKDDFIRFADPDYPESHSVRWYWGHDKCLESVISPYRITADRFQALGDALHWTLHLAGKRWIGLTNWETIVRRLHEVPNP